MTTIITVTKKHIKAGKPCTPSCCPVALALRDAGFIDPRVSEQQILWSEKASTPHSYGVRITAVKKHTLGTYLDGKMAPFVTTMLHVREPSRSVSRFVRSYDAGRRVKPFSFRLPRDKSRP